MSAPLLRFSEFDNNWLTKSFGNTFTGLPNNTLSRAELSDEDGSVKNVHYGDVLIKYGAFLDAAEESIPFISSGELAEKWKNAALQSGDVIIADTAEDTTAGKCTEIGKAEGDTIVAGLHTIPVHPRFEFAAGYLGYYMNSDAFHNQLLPLMQGTKVTSISKTYLSETSLRFPTDLAEQGKIAGLLRNLDCDITLQQRKCDKLIALKAACLDKMFPKNGSKVPELRFAGFSGDWEQRKLGDIADSYSGGTPTAGKTEYYGGNIPFIRSAEINSDSTELFLTEEGLNNSSAKMVKKGDILYALYGATSGETGLARIDGAINQAILDIKPHAYYDAPFIMHWLRKSKESIIGTYLQGGQGNLSGTIVTSLLIDCPKYEEQKRIGEFFTYLDNTITLHQRKLEKLRQLKQAMLHKMFV